MGSAGNASGAPILLMLVAVLDAVHDRVQSARRVDRKPVGTTGAIHRAIEQVLVEVCHHPRVRQLGERVPVFLRQGEAVSELDDHSTLLEQPDRAPQLESIRLAVEQPGVEGARRLGRVTSTGSLCRSGAKTAYHECERAE